MRARSDRDATQTRAEWDDIVADAEVGAAMAGSFLGKLSSGLVEEQQTAINAFGSVRQRMAAHLLDLASAQQRPQGRLVTEKVLALTERMPGSGHPAGARSDRGRASARQRTMRRRLR